MATDARSLTANRTRYRVLKGQVMVGLCVLSLLVALVPLGAILFSITRQGISSVSLAFLTQLPNPPGMPGGGVKNAIVGTVWVVVISTVISTPVGIGAGIYLSEFGEGIFARLIRFLTEVLSSLPSIIAGVVIYGLIVIPMAGASALAGGVALSVLAIPWVTVATEDALSLVPESHRDASLALGTGKTTTILSVVLPEAFGGVITGAMLGVARVAGETAPLLWTAGDSTFGFQGITEGTATLSVSIYLNAIQPYPGSNAKAWGAAFLLIVFVLATNVLTRTLWNRRQRSIRGD